MAQPVTIHHKTLDLSPVDELRVQEVLSTTICFRGGTWMLSREYIRISRSLRVVVDANTATYKQNELYHLLQPGSVIEQFLESRLLRSPLAQS